MFSLILLSCKIRWYRSVSKVLGCRLDNGGSILRGGGGGVGFFCYLPQPDHLVCYTMPTEDYSQNLKISAVFVSLSKGNARKFSHKPESPPYKFLPVHHSWFSGSSRCCIAHETETESLHFFFFFHPLIRLMPFRFHSHLFGSSWRANFGSLSLPIPFAWINRFDLQSSVLLLTQ